jgi:voltage-gated potassium channel
MLKISSHKKPGVIGKKPEEARNRPLIFLRQLWRVLKREKFPHLFIICLVIVIIGAIGYYSFEIAPSTDAAVRHRSVTNHVFDALWWSCVTVTTVGYGDISPKTPLGRMVGLLVMFSGVVVMSLITAIIASILVERKIREEKGLESITLTNHIVICGWNEHVTEILSMVKQNREASKSVVLINDLEEEQITEIKFKYRGELDIHFIRGDFVNESVLERANIPHASSVILLSDLAGKRDRAKADERVILATLTIKHMADKVRVTAELMDRENESHLHRARADEIIIRGQYGGFFLASSALSPGISSLVECLLSNDKHQIMKTKIPPRFIGHTFREVFDYARNELKSILIGIISVSKGMSFDDLLSEDLSSIDLFIKRKFEEAGADLSASLDQFNVQINPPDSYKIQDNDLAVVIYSGGSKGVLGG